MLVGDRYEVTEKLGKGGMGTVYKARHLHLDKIVAIKVLNGDELDAPRLQRFEQEAKVINSLSHPNIVGIQDYGITTDGEPFIVMEYVEGQTLEQLIQQKNRLSVDESLPIFREICVALEHIHQAGVIHRDLKPSNILLAQNREGQTTVKLADFGIAKQTQVQQQRLTETGAVLGSPYYASPEQMLGDKIDARSDMYSLGCLMYEALSGNVPFAGENAMQTFMLHLNAEPQRLEANVPRWLENIVWRALAKDPRDRFQSAGELLIQLDQGTSGWNGKLVRTRRRKWYESAAKVGVALGVLMLLGSLTLLSFPGVQNSLHEQIAKIKLSTVSGRGVDEDFLQSIISEGNQQLLAQHDKAAMKYYQYVVALTADRPDSASRADAMCGEIAIVGIRKFPMDTLSANKHQWKELMELLTSGQKNADAEKSKHFMGELSFRAFKLAEQMKSELVTDAELESLVAPLVAADYPNTAAKVELLLSRRYAQKQNHEKADYYFAKAAGRGQDGSGK
jgi:serine/threonine protein kinase